MDMATEHGVHVIAVRIMRHSSFEFSDKAHRVFHTPLGAGAERPVTQTKTAPEEINKGIEREQKLITKVAGECEPVHVLHHCVQFAAMNDQNSFPRGGYVNCLLLDLDVPVSATKVGHQLVVIARDVDHMRAFAGFAQNFLDYIVVLLRPVNSAAQRPNIDQVAHNVERIEIVLAQKIEQCDVRRAIEDEITQRIAIGQP